MIDNLISNTMKKIWINLEFYFKRYKFSNFKDFSKFFYEFNLIYFGLNSLKIIYFITC